MSRGIVVGARVSATSGFSMTGSVEIEDLLQGILYWHEIMYTGIAMGGGSISGNHNADVAFLESVGVFKNSYTYSRLNLRTCRHQIPAFQSWGSPSINSRSQAQPHDLRYRIDCGKRRKGFGQSGGECLLLPPSGVSADMIDIQLFDCLPVPGPGTAFEDVLELTSV